EPKNGQLVAAAGLGLEREFGKLFPDRRKAALDVVKIAGTGRRPDIIPAQGIVVAEVGNRDRGVRRVLQNHGKLGRLDMPEQHDARAGSADAPAQIGSSESWRFAAQSQKARLPADLGLGERDKSWR